jgi:DNA-binding transcriptional regulator LsrR (DeoR family)
MEEKDIWADVFQAVRHMESIRADYEMAESARDQEIATLYKAGIPKVQLARRLNLSRPTIDRILADQGVKE